MESQNNRNMRELCISFVESEIAKMNAIIETHQTNVMKHKNGNPNNEPLMPVTSSVGMLERWTPEREVLIQIHNYLVDNLQ